MSGRDASWRERPKRRRVSSQREGPAAALPSGAAHVPLEGCSTASQSAPAALDLAVGGSALRLRGQHLPRLCVSDLPCAHECDWDPFPACSDPDVYNAAEEGWFARCFSCGQRTARSVHAVGFCLMTCARCQRAFRQKAEELKATTGSEALAADHSRVGPGSPGDLGPVSPDQAPCPPPRCVSRLALDEDCAWGSSRDGDSRQSSPQAVRSARRRAPGVVKPAGPSPLAAAPSAAAEEQLKGLFGRLRSHMLAHSPHLAILARSIVPPPGESSHADAR